MNIYHSIAELGSIERPTFLAIGVFDGVHLGHQAVIHRALDDARAANGCAVAVTFDPHPLRILRPEKAPRLLTSTAHKSQLIRALGVEHLLVIPFDAAFAAQPPQDFVVSVHRACRSLREICVGHEWSFGKNRAGNLALLDEMGERLGFSEVGIPAVKIEGEVVSSTLIRAAVEAGDLEKAARFLGREYTILGTVVRGNQLGRQLGFPTANLVAHNEQFPPDGVYAVEVSSNDFSDKNGALKGVANIGVRPTLNAANGERLLEAHLFDFDEDLYGKDLEVIFRRYLRGERKFENLAALKAQIERDAEAARATFR